MLRSIALLATAGLSSALTCIDTSPVVSSSVPLQSVVIGQTGVTGNGLVLSDIHSRHQGATAWLPAANVPDASTFTYRCCDGHCDVTIVVIQCLPCTAGKNGGLPALFASRGYSVGTCGGKIDGQVTRSYHTVLAQGEELDFATSGPTNGLALIERSIRPAGTTFTLPAFPLPMTSVVHGIIIDGGSDVEISGESAFGDFTYAEAGPFETGMVLWGNRPYTVDKVQAPIEGLTYYRPSQQEVAADAVITVRASGVFTVYILFEVDLFRNGGWRTSLPTNPDWTQRMVNQEPCYHDPTVGTELYMQVFSQSFAIAESTPQGWCPKPAGPFPHVPCNCAVI